MRTRIRKTLLDVVKELRKRNDRTLARGVRKVARALWVPPTREIAQKREKQVKEIDKALRGFGLKKDLVRFGTKYETGEMSPKDMNALVRKMTPWWKQLLSKHGFKIYRGHSGAKHFVKNTETNVELALYSHVNRKAGTVSQSVVVDL